MARPKSEDKRNAILVAATRVIATQGLSAPTAMIAHEAGVANGTLFTYFATKADLLNHLYLELKAEMAKEVAKGTSDELEPRERFFHVWKNWISWATAHPEKRRVLTQLSVSEDITPETRATANKGITRIGELMEQIRANGPMSNAPKELVVEIIDALANATIDYILATPDNAEAYCKIGFDALWRVVGSF